MSLTAESRGFVVRGRFATPAKGDRPEREHWSWWYGPDHGWGTTWGPLDYSVHVFASRPAARTAATSLLHPVRRAVVVPVQDAIAWAIEDAKERREAAVAAKRSNVAIACTDEIRRLRRLQR